MIRQHLLPMYGIHSWSGEEEHSIDGAPGSGPRRVVMQASSAFPVSNYVVVGPEQFRSDLSSGSSDPLRRVQEASCIIGDPTLTG